MGTTNANATVKQEPRKSALRQQRDSLRDDAIGRALEESRGDVATAAALVGFSRSYLYALIGRVPELRRARARGLEVMLQSRLKDVKRDQRPGRRQRTNP